MNSPSPEINTHLSRNDSGLDMLWGTTLILIIALLVIPKSQDIFIQASKNHVYSTAFIKFAVLATMGELLAVRILKGRWEKPAGLVWRIAVWGLLGILIALVFFLYASGVGNALKAGLLPSPGGDWFGSKLAFALFTSTLMNLLFAPTFMAFHRITDTYIDLGEGDITRIVRLGLSEVLEQIDWNDYIKFVVCKTIPFFWIPAHTLTFLLPPEHRVLTAAFLSIALGAILGYSKRHDT